MGDRWMWSARGRALSRSTPGGPRSAVARARVGPVVQSRPAGVALILVLWLLVLLGVVTATIAHRAHLEARMVEADRARTSWAVTLPKAASCSRRIRIEEILDSTPELGERATAFRTDTLGTWGRDRELGNARFRVAVIEFPSMPA